ncbi:TPA: class I SAM-dependent methyltransferase [Streptococcus suis]|nr:class I SAM-dependent methyltransferase [Streptococcus suis]HEM3899127.1 class I SAM-dependent methyltransferase [Streptococcus suis]HEM3905470.1 class I SAM-dependent methyltransferase [Streptococcus suis]HEM3934761.1 class I SAM-dependent methyltransferase [Streptococcus suis]
MRPEYEAEVIETLENTFGAVNDTTSIENVVKESIANAVEDNIADYISDFMSLGAGSDIEYLSADEANALYLELIRNSVSYMVMARLGLDADKVYSPDDFAGISNFNSQEVLNAVGIATSDIAEMALLPVSRTISSLSKENRIIDEQGQSEYNKDIKDERSQSDERNHIHDGGRLQSSEPEAAGADGSDSRQMVADEENLSEGTSQNPVLQSSDERDSEQSLGGGSAESERTGGNSREADGRESGTDRADESRRYDEMGSIDEQHQELGTGNREESGNIRLEYYDRNHEDKSLPFFGGDDTIREILGTTPHLSASKEEIKDFYKRNTDNATRTEYIKGIFNNDYTQLTLSDGRLVGYKTFQNVLHLWEGEYENRTAQSFYDWGVIAQHFEAMRLLGELTDTMKPLPSMDGQLTLIMGNQAEEQKTSAFTFSQEIIDAVLTRGSGVSEGKMRIYEQFEKSLSAKENADFLKNEYGWGGSYPVIIGAGIDEQHDGKGITISKGIGSDKPHITLSWSQVEKRIGDLIRMDRYLNPKEKEKYPEWLEKQDERRAELAEQRKNREILSTAPPEPENKEDEPEAKYEYHLGDSVYIGASQYEILSFDENRVMLYDFDMPLFNKELSREEFDRKVRENPMNDHLKVSVLPAEEKAVTGENEVQNDTETVQDFSPKTGYDDAFFIDRDNESVAWMYYNPDSNAGGQYVTNTLSFDEIQQAAREYDSAEDFFDYLGSIANQELADVGTEWFVDADREFHRTPDLTDCTSATMEALIENAERTDMVATNIGNVPIEDYREIVATQNGFDSYEEMYNEGVRIGNGYDKKPEPIVPAWEQKKKSKVKSFDLHPDIPMSERHNFDLANNQVEEVNKKERFHRNYAAIKVLKDCQNENRFATPDEQKILSRYVGWGGIPEAFDERAGAWHTEYAMLKNILTPEEYASARESTLTAFYTPPEVSTAIYKVLEQMGFQEGNLLEPSCGIGNFIGMLPKSMENAKVYGVELDTISAGIAQQLYQKASIAAQGFEEVNVPDSFFDGVIGNVPFGDFKVSDKRYDKYNFLIHDYFFAKSLDKLRPGGVMALVTSKGTMDKENSNVRKYIAQRAELLGAIRLPNDTFKGNAGTEVVSEAIPV